MNNLKGQVFVGVCLGVVLLVLAGLAWPIGSWESDLRARMDERVTKAATATKLVKPMPVPEIPMTPAITGPVLPEHIARKDAVLRWIRKQADEIAAASSESNRKGRVAAAGGGEYVPLMPEYGPQKGYLPAISANVDAHDFRTMYNAVFKTWALRLATGQDKVTHENEWLVDLETQMLPPSQPVLQEKWIQYKREAAKTAGADMGGRPLTPDLGFGGAVDAERTTYYRGELTGLASRLKMYVNPTAFQIRDWASKPVPPNAEQIFDALVELWIQQDLVNTCTELNRPAANLQSGPIKLVERFAIGAAPAATPLASGNAGMFSQMVPTVAGQRLGHDSPQGALFLRTGSAPAVVDYGKSMTGRIGSERWDVTQVYVTLHMTPAGVNAFINELSKRNNGYTVLSVRLETVDPYEAVSYGYFYGTGQGVVRAEFQIEAILFREWTEKLMPEGTRTALGLPPSKR